MDYKRPVTALLELCTFAIMETIRQNKISRLIQKEMGEMFQMELGNIRGHAMITVTQVNVTKDLSIARIYLSLFATDDKKALFERILVNQREIRHLLAMRVKKQLRVVPDLEFHIDDTLDYIQHIEDLLKQ
jgi:ribosome-binding factor A